MRAIKALHQTGHAIDGFSWRCAFSRVSRLLSLMLDRRSNVGERR
jgi:hypothetical protein